MLGCCHTWPLIHEAHGSVYNYITSFHWLACSPNILLNYLQVFQKSFYQKYQTLGLQKEVLTLTNSLVVCHRTKPYSHSSRAKIEIGDLGKKQSLLTVLNGPSVTKYYPNYSIIWYFLFKELSPRLRAGLQQTKVWGVIARGLGRRHSPRAMLPQTVVWG